MVVENQQAHIFGVNLRAKPSNSDCRVGLLSHVKSFELLISDLSRLCYLDASSLSSLNSNLLIELSLDLNLVRFCGGSGCWILNE